MGALMGAIYLEESSKYILTTDHTAYCFGIDTEGNLQHIYWGRKLPREEDYPDCHAIGQTVGIGKNLENPKNLGLNDFFYPYEATKAVIDEEYAGWGGLNFVEPSLKVMFAAGVRDLVLKHYAHQFKTESELVVTLKDVYYSLFLHLHYRVLADVDLIVRWVEIDNRCTESVQLERVQSAVWYVPNHRTYRLSYLTGRWANEFNLNQMTVPPGRLVMESRRGITSHHATPWFALDAEGAATEQIGKVWFGTLAWSGNWKMVIEYTSNNTAVTGGINDFDFAWNSNRARLSQRLSSSEDTLNKGGRSSRLLHRYGRRYVIPQIIDQTLAGLL
jgi:alpha-galactosidase